MMAALRPSGLGGIKQVPWGGHICMFYETPDDLLDSVASFLAAGLENNEFCLWAVGDPLTVDAALAWLRRSGGLEQYFERGQLEIVPAGRFYLEDDNIRLQGILDRWAQKARVALANGYDGMRAAGDTAWVGHHHWHDFSEYEHQLNHYLSGKKLICLCTYPMQVSGSKDLLDVTRSHRCSIVRQGGEWKYLTTLDEGEPADAAGGPLGTTAAVVNPLPPLTARERAVLGHVLSGASSKEAGLVLGITARTVEFHRANIMKKFGVRNTAALVRAVLDAAAPPPVPPRSGSTHG